MGRDEGNQAEEDWLDEMLAGDLDAIEDILLTDRDLEVLDEIHADQDLMALEKIEPILEAELRAPNMQVLIDGLSRALDGMDITAPEALMVFMRMTIEYTVEVASTSGGTQDEIFAAFQQICVNDAISDREDIAAAENN